MRITDILSDIGRPVSFYPGLRKITGSTTATLFLCQLIYWNGKQSDPDGWIYKTSDEIEEETGLSYEEQVTARKQLVKLGFIEEQYKRLDHKMLFRIMANRIDEVWRNQEHPVPETGNAQFGNKAMPGSLNKVNTETTTEITAENTAVVVVENEPEPVSGSEPPQPQRPNIYSIYEKEVGALTPFIADSLDEIERTYPAGWFLDAVREAKLSSSRVSLKYILSILSRWKAEGRGDRRRKTASEPLDPRKAVLEDLKRKVANGESL
jgi:hypothetical protein